MGKGNKRKTPLSHTDGRSRRAERAPQRHRLPVSVLSPWRQLATPQPRAAKLPNEPPPACFGQAKQITREHSPWQCGHGGPLSARRDAQRKRQSVKTPQFVSFQGEGKKGGCTLQANNYELQRLMHCCDRLLQSPMYASPAWLQSIKPAS